MPDARKSDAAPRPGTVYLVGAGPGDPGLMTLRGLACLRRADVVIYDYLANPALLGEAPAAAGRVYVGKSKGRHCMPQEEINRLLAEHARAGRTVVRLKGGDPFIFGRGGEEARFLAAAGIPFEVVPGVTAGLAAAAYAGIPLTHRDYTTSLAMVTGHLTSERDLDHVDWARLARGVGTLVIYMGISNLGEIAARLVRHGRDPQTPVALVRWASTPRQETLTGTLADITARVAASNFQPPAVIIIGEVVALRDTLRWFDNRPLFGRRILVTRAADQAEAMLAPLRELGAEPVSCPTIGIVPPPTPADLDAAIARLAETDYLILTSANAVEAFFARLQAGGRDARALAGVTVAAVGPKTAEALAAFGVRADLIPESYDAEGVVALLRERVAGKRVLYPRAALARDLIIRELGAAGAEVTAPVAYASAVPPGAAETAHAALANGLDLLTFTASSTVRNFAALLDPAQLAVARAIPVAVIGPQTAATARELGFTVAVEPAAATIEALVAAIVDYFEGAGAQRSAPGTQHS
ncbi:MAG: uroporphyrinogen-III C-methyltransferase [Deltaproteobacteria bacterium]|nr:MAG: uroporphyrinogen-III C-methyltransferase [Deltaproteobacteria bacterium]